MCGIAGYLFSGMALIIASRQKSTAIALNTQNAALLLGHPVKINVQNAPAPA